MASRFGDLMAGLGGADKTILDEVPQDRARFTQMAGLLLTTAGIAVLAMTFALHNGVKVPLFPAIVLGIAWGIVILNIDRFLVISMGDSRTRRWRLAGIMLPRFALAVLIALVVSTPLVLRIFASDINEQLSVMHEQQSKRFAELEKHSQDQLLANSMATYRRASSTLPCSKHRRRSAS
jgi:ABC-type transport system involved in multi-copper enzyme maturation permease subunit